MATLPSTELPLAFGDALKRDCALFRSDRPCSPHKLRGNTCPMCDEYAPQTERILIIKLAAMGDVLRTTCLLRGLKARFQAPIVWITRPESVDLLRHNPYLAEIWSTDEDLAARLEVEAFRAVVNVDAERQSAGLCTMARSDAKLGFALDAHGNVTPLNEPALHWFCMGINDELKRQNQKTYQQIIAAIAGVEAARDDLVFALTEQERQTTQAFAALALPANHDAVVGFNTGGAGRWQRKQWTFNGFVGLGRLILQQTGHCIVLYGGAGEEDFNARLERQLNSPRVINVNTRRSIRDFGAMLALCDVLVTGDTLGLHLAAALGRRVVAIFGPTSAAEIELYGRGRKVLPAEPCRSFYSLRCEATPCCVETISPATVFEAVQDCLAAVPCRTD